MKPSCNFSDLVRQIKKSSNAFAKESKLSKFRFNWQKGYGAFSYSHSQLTDVIRYIINQKEHHKKKAFKEEYIDLLTKYEVSFEERFLFEWLE